MGLTIAYITTRKDNRFHWFADSLRDQLTNEEIETGLRIVVVDANVKDMSTSTSFNDIPDIEFILTPPKPSIWQGEHRLTKQNWFAAANARNTALCFAPDPADWIAYVDDLSVLCPGWLQSVRDSTRGGGYIALGTYEKVKDLVVENGCIVSFTPYSQDARLRHAHGELHSCGGEWLYGCSLAGPVQAFLDVNGWPEYCDGLGSEDYCMGIAIGNLNKYGFRFDKRMKTFESEELHHVGETFKKSDFGISPNDCSHAALNLAKGSKWFPHYLGEGFADISELRQHILKGGEFPIRKHPEHHWWTGIRLADL